eukprot:TRINITY_DN40194_c0_g1_i1.p1 TRINITY_DN40194_c0_g1~~TRINITY_DN40194_c0_g1_i1.p1  ORF type:complete len:214 (-),score=20.00 TRINITY_DN40194_c0_g1_i1:100-672(-)
MAGLAFAVFIGMHHVIPADSGAYYGLPRAVYYGSSVHPALMILILGVRHLGYAIYHSLDKAEVVMDAEGLCLGLGIGLCAGLVLGIRAVNPEKHGFVSVFVDGLRCQHVRQWWACASPLGNAYNDGKPFDFFDPQLPDRDEEVTAAPSSSSQSETASSSPSTVPVSTRHANSIQARMLEQYARAQYARGR